VGIRLRLLTSGFRLALSKCTFPTSLATRKSALARFINSSRDASFVANAIPTLATMLAVARVDNGDGSDSSEIVRCASAAMAEQGC